jgi:hypothetical protein
MQELHLPDGTKMALNRRESDAALEDHLRPLVEIGVFETGTRYVFRCGTCGKTEVCDQRMGPACTGPSWTDDHPIEPMTLVGVR